jgi:two-component system, OmpR family, response regulator BaeR
MTTHRAHILIVEDEAKIATVLKEYLLASGFDASIIDRGDSAVEAVRSGAFALLLLDVMLPGMDGIAVCREIRTFSTVPIILLTARVEEIDRLLGLELGADDYICKPFFPREVMARVRTLLRRANWTQSPPEIQPALEIDPLKFQAKMFGELLPLTPVEFRLLATLAAHPGRVYSRAQLQSQCYLDHRIVSDRTVDSHIKNLRRKFEDLRPGCDPIRAIYGMGYKYAPELD